MPSLSAITHPLLPTRRQRQSDQRRPNALPRRPRLILLRDGAHVHGSDITQTIVNFTSLKWIVPHAGGAFPAIGDRFLTAQSAELQARSKEAYATRLFWDVASLVFPRQVLGLLGCGMPVSQLLYGSVCCFLRPGGREYGGLAVCRLQGRISRTRQTSPTSMRLRRLKVLHSCLLRRRCCYLLAIMKHCSENGLQALVNG